MDLRQLSIDIRSKSELYAGVISACRSLLKKAPEAQAHFKYIKQRLSPESIEKWDIGYFPPDEHLHLLTDIIGNEVLCKLRLMYEFNQPVRSHYNTIKKTIFNHHNIIFPYSDEYSNIITLAGRTILSEVERKTLCISKYKNAPFTKQMHLFGLLESGDAIEINDGVIIVEGQIDCINCHAKGFLNVVALAGSDLNMHQIFLLKRKTNNIYLLLDNDEAGKSATSKIVKNYSKFVNIQVLELPKEYGDVDEYLTNSGQCDVLRAC